MKISELLKNPIIKSIGIIVILYFALFANKENPHSLGNRLSSENIKKNLDIATKQTKFIASNVKTARQLAKEKELEQQKESSPTNEKNEKE